LLTPLLNTLPTPQLSLSLQLLSALAPWTRTTMLPPLLPQLARPTTQWQAHSLLSD